ncbi:unnamed protein product [Didymodactylos carnosus]|uniref:Syndecan n=1 Tax=Didymodactylos carnosus TaxID=1234261 RepID=A0A813YEB6_9BILA|nr:unnamed protein product [Didymodactylos carnosus]CAF1413841.1 unnamed protein product [Didymodactylos carnosus]CAF3668780.1 unnamed protein product [Didymodactylos carnosus]CAF4216891.1 unnamed protein product [Didymodactylos carnosus]
MIIKNNRQWMLPAIFLLISCIVVNAQIRPVAGYDGGRNKTSTISTTTLLNQDIDNLNSETDDSDDFSLYDDNDEQASSTTISTQLKQNLSFNDPQQLLPTTKQRSSSVKYPSGMSSSQKNDQTIDEHFDDEDDSTYDDYNDLSDERLNSSSIHDSENGKNDYSDTSLNNNNIKPEQQNNNKFNNNMNTHTTLKLPIVQSSVWKDLFSKPGTLAGIVGGVVIGLLSAILLVMFIIYRMRKKDEGSYALEEERKSPSHAYTRVSSREFFA